jgi:hypothetical protein
MHDQIERLNKVQNELQIASNLLMGPPETQSDHAALLRAVIELEQVVRILAKNQLDA